MTSGSSGARSDSGAVRYRIVRLQVQTEPLKVGRAPLRTYDPSAIESMPRLEIGPAGVIGLTERLGSVIDVHHRDHPRSRDRRGRGGVSVMGTGDYRRLRSRYGAHLTEGIAGETILVDAPDGLAGLDLPVLLTLHTAQGPIPLAEVRVADPCVEFSRFCLGQTASPVVDGAVKQALIDLDQGARGYRGMATGSGLLALGDEVEVAQPTAVGQPDPVLPA